MKKIIVAPDSFKGSISAPDAARAIADGIHEVCPEAQTVIIPIADGGEGTLEALTTPECRMIAPAFNTNGAPAEALIGYIGNTAVIESARAVGLGSVPPAERDPELSTSRGVGSLITAALERGFEKIMLTVGGTGSNDGGAGMLEALGAVFYGRRGRINGIRARDLADITAIDISALDRRLFCTGFTVACDVTNPLTGNNGATFVYGPQKGADGAIIDRLENGMKNYAVKLAAISRDVSRVPGIGAGGGIPAPLVAILGARIIPGIDAVLDAAGFDRALTDADLVITGEGRIDSQSACGKAINGVAARAAARGVPVVAVAGQLGDGAEIMLRHGISDMYSLADTAPDIGYAIAHPAPLLHKTGAAICRDRYIHDDLRRNSR